MMDLEFELSKIKQALAALNSNKAHMFSPYDYQKELYKAGSDYKRRFLMGANRIGKSFGMAYEMSAHLTGIYPDWWEGHRFEKPILAWAIGITGESTQNVLQKELFGTENAKFEEDIGTGAIPKKDIVSLERDGSRITSARIKHKLGVSTLQFKSTAQGEHTLMGATVDFVWMDELDPIRDLQFYSQCVTRTGTTGGHVVITATPENGLTPLVAQFQDAQELPEEERDLYLLNATWNDAPHLDEETKRELLASIPSWQHDMRSKGLPLLGSGLVFEMNTKEVLISDCMIDPEDKKLWSIDLSRTNDAMVVSLMVMKGSIEFTPGGDKVDDRTVAIAKQWYLTEDAHGNNQRKPHIVADIVLNSKYAKAPFIIPNDGSGAEGQGAVLKQLGVNVMAETAYLSREMLSTSWRSHNTASTTGVTRDKEPALYHMNEWFRSGKLFIHESCNELLREMTTYCRLPGTNGAIKYGGMHPDAIDSFRYGFVSMVSNRGWDDYEMGIA